jgi:hypothetical protein
MQLTRAALVQLAREDDKAVLAGVTTLVGSSSLISAAFLPWVEKAAFGVSFTTLGIQDGAILQTVLAMISAGIAAVLLQRPVAVRVAVILIVLAVAELSLAIWNAANIVHAIEVVDSHHLWISAIGTGAYLGVLGSVITCVGGILAWTKRGSRISSANADRTWSRGHEGPS